MERDFDKHVKYVEHESRAQQLLRDVPELKEHLDKFSQKINDEKTIQEHLKLPLQRINDYQLILKVNFHSSAPRTASENPESFRQSPID